MSKIEDALNKARAKGKGRLPERSTTAATGKTSLHLVPAAETRAVAVHDNRLLRSRAIAKMEEGKQLTRQQLAESRIVYREMKENRVADAFREIRTRLLQHSNGNNAVIMVTTMSSENGSSFVALNLAVSFSFDESKTGLLIDCNLPHPCHHDLITDDTHYGLTDYLENDDMDISEIVHQIGIPRLRLIPAGSRREVSVEYFTSLKMQGLLDSVKQRYPDRYVVVDAPPVLEYADAQIIAELCDYVLLVIPYGRVTEQKINAAVKAIGKEKLIGVVFNGEPKLPNLFSKKR